MASKRCKRMQVYALGMDKDNNLEQSHNSNQTIMGCTNEPGKCGCTHAEINLLKKMENPQVVVTSHSPCINCAEALVNAGIQSIYFLKEYRILDGVRYLRDHNVGVYLITESGPVKYRRVYE